MTEDSADEPTQDSGSKPQPATGEKPRRVPKTMLFDVPTAEAIEAYAAAAASQHHDAPASTSEDAINTEKVLPVDSQPVSAEELEKKRQVAQKQSARRVAKTLLFGEINLDAVKQAAQAASVEANLISVEAQPAAPVSVPREKRVRKIAKTLQESALGSFGQEQLHPAPAEVESTHISRPEALSEAVPEALTDGSVKPKRQHFVAKTMLDHSILWDTVSKFEAKMEERVAEQMLERANEPIKPFIPIVCKKQATPCAFTWDDPDTRERFRYCDLCKTPVYNFTGLEQPEADELIFQRENRRNATLYKRADGKYMTVNCPVEVKRKRDMVFMSLGGVLLFAAAIAFMIWMPRPPKPEPKAVVEDRPAAVTTGSSTSTGPRQPSPPPAGSDDGSFRMVNGQRVYPAGSSPGPSAGTAPVNFPPPVQAPAATTDADESGQFWQYDSPPGQR
ncbi:hypothetical protein KBI23_13550 [bacterium]|nr:hypothetical protein [bacterium]MBP9808539.1 hypothetical protein [bacterium]